MEKINYLVHPSYESIVRYKKSFIKKGFALLECNEKIRKIFKNRGLWWYYTNLSWYK